MKLQHVASHLIETSLPADVDPRTGLSRRDPESNISMILDDISEIMTAIDQSLDDVSKRSDDRWGTQGSLQKIKSDLLDLYQFATGKSYYGK